MRAFIGLNVNYASDDDGDFLPTDISDLSLWLDADDASTITESSNLISQWDDKSGNGNDVTQGTGSDQPLYNSGAGATVELQDTSDDLTGTASYVSPYTVFTVFKMTASVGTRGVIAGDGAADGLWRMGRQTGVNRYSVDNTSVSDTTVDLVNFRLFRAIENGSTSAFFINGVDETDDSAPLGDIGVFSVGGGIASSATSEIKEVLIYERELTSGEITQVEDFLNDKHGL